MVVIQYIVFMIAVQNPKFHTSNVKIPKVVYLNVEIPNVVNLNTSIPNCHFTRKSEKSLENFGEN